MKSNILNVSDDQEANTDRDAQMIPLETDKKRNSSSRSCRSNRSSSFMFSEHHPLRFAEILVQYPCRIIGVFFVSVIIFAICDYMVFAFSAETFRDWLVNTDSDAHKIDAITLSVDDITGSSKTKALPKTQDEDHLTIATIFKTRDGSNILQGADASKRLQYINSVNTKITNTSYAQYYKLCWADTASFPDCSQYAISDPLFASIAANSLDPSSITQSQLDVVVNASADMLGPLFYANFEASFPTSRSSQYYRTFFFFGLPYPDINATTSSYRTKQEDYYKQQENYDEWILPIWRDIQLEHNNDPDIEVVIYGTRINSLGMVEFQFSGVMWSGASIMAVYLIMFYHMHSLFLATVAMIQIIAGFPFSYFLYRIVFGITYFGSLSLVVIFIILGIAADDCFVFVDAWVQSESVVENPLSVMQRMTYTYRRSIHAMAVTTFTTVIAFLATGFSPIMPISAFGIWAAIVVMVNYLLMLTVFPAFLSWHFQYVKDYEKCPQCWHRCWSRLKSSNNSNNQLQVKQQQHKELKTDDTDQANYNNNNNVATISYSPSSHLSQRDVSIRRRMTGDFEGTLKQKQEFVKKEPSRSTEKFLRDVWSVWIMKYRYYIVSAFTLLVALSAWQTSKLQGLSEQVTFFDDDHFMQKMYTWMDDFYGGNINSLLTTNLMFGVEPTVDRSGSDIWSSASLGTPVYNPDFDISSSAAQQYIYDICYELKTQHNDKLYSASTELKCFLFDLIDYANTTLNMSFPFVFSGDSEIQKQQFTQLIATWTSQDATGQSYLSNGNVGYHGLDDELKFILITFPLQIGTFDDYGVKKPQYDFWENRIAEWNEAAPEGVTDAFQAAWGFAWMSSEKGFMTSAVQGIGIALPLAFIVLLVSTHNWIVSVFAIITIIGIILTEIMIMVLQGWELGVSESISIVIMIGFSVDYVVHFASAYIECKFSEKRKSRIKFSLYTMGISIVSGAVTTFVAGFFLIFPDFKFFNQFGILIMSVVIVSVFYATMYFMALLAVAGPQGKQGMIPMKTMWQTLKKKICPCKQ